MQVEEKKACGSCGAENSATASFCWKCFAAFAPFPSAPGMPAAPPAPFRGRPGFNEPGIPSSAPASTGRRFSSKVIAAILAALVAAASAAFFGGWFRQDHSLPDSIAGLPRIVTADAKQLEGQIRQLGDSFDLHIEAAMYGTSDVPEYIVMLVDESAIETTDSLFDSFVSGVASSGAVVNTAGTISGDKNGVDYRCLPIQGSGMSAGACMWRAEATVGIVFQLNASVQDTRTTLWAVYDQVTG